jgi:hypothetical protein
VLFWELPQLELLLDRSLVGLSRSTRAGVGVRCLNPSNILPRLIPNHHTGFYLNLPVGAITVTTLIISGIPDAKLKSEVKTSVKEQVDRLDLPGCIL